MNDKAREAFEAWWNDPNSADNTKAYDVVPTAEVLRLCGDVARQSWTAALQWAASQQAAENGDTLYLWKNGDHFLAFKHLYPCYSPGGDPMTLGEPCARAEFRASHDRAAAPTAQGGADADQA